MNAKSALCPSTATGTTCTPSASAAFTAATTSSPSVRSVRLQKRWTTPRPTDGETGSVMGSVCPRRDRLVAVDDELLGRVHREAATAREARQQDACSPRGLDGESRRRRYRNDRAEARRPRFLHD